MEVAPGRRRTSWAYGWLILATVVITCAPVAYSNYAFADDYWILSIRPLEGPPLTGAIHGFMNEGRPLFPLWALGVMGQFDTIGDLKFVRMLTLVALVLNALVFYKLVNRHLIEDPLSATLTASFFAINPTFLIMAGWATIGCDAYASLFGLLSICVLLSDPRYDRASPENPAPGYGRLTLSAFCLLVSLCLYQPGAMLFWTGAAIWIIGRFTGNRADWFKLVRIGLVFLAVLGVYMALAHLLASAGSRVHVSTDIVRRLGWFVLFPLKSSLCYPLTQTRVVWSVVALIILAYGLWSYCRQNGRSQWIPPLIALLSPATVLPTIVAFGHYDVSRTRGALYGLIIVLWYVAFKAIGARFQAYRKAQMLAGVLLVALVFFGQYHLRRYLIVPQVWEENALAISLQKYVRENPNLDRPFAIWPPAFPFPAGFRSGDEIGTMSLAREGDPPYEIRQMLAEITHRKSEDVPKVNIVTLSATDVPPADAFVLDYRQLPAPQ